MNNIIRQIIALPNMRFKPGVDEKSIRLFEECYGFSLPNAYKEWLSVTDGGEIFVPGVELYGIRDEYALLKIRRGNGIEAPEHLVVIGRTAYGDVICFMENSEKIIQLDHETNEEYMSFDNFYSYLEAAEEMYGESDEQ